MGDLKTAANAPATGGQGKPPGECPAAWGGTTGDGISGDGIRSLGAARGRAEALARRRESDAFLYVARDYAGYDRWRLWRGGEPLYHLVSQGDTPRSCTCPDYVRGRHEDGYCCVHMDLLLRILTGEDSETRAARRAGTRPA